MMAKRRGQQIEMHLITIEDLVPMDHLLRKVNDIIDFSFIFEEVVKKNHEKDGSERDTKEEPGLGRLPNKHFCGPLKIKQSTIDRFGYFCYAIR